MRAARLYGPRDLRVVEVAEPEPPGPGEVLIEITYSGICGTDAHEWEHGGPMTPLTSRHTASNHVGPTTIGHEFTGTVRAVGDRVQHLKVGQRVVCGAGVSCGTCRNCQRGRTNLCEQYYTHGLNLDGGMAEHVVVPAAICVPVPDSCPDARAALAQPLAIAMHAISRADLTGARTALVVGAGGIGALVIASLADRPVRVVAADLSPERLAAASALGADDVVLIAKDGPVSSIAVDVAFETSGAAQGLALAFGAVGRGGQVVILGLPNRPVDLDVRRAVIDEIDLIMSSAHVCAADLPAAVELLSRRNIDTTIIADVIELEDLAERGLSRLASGEAGGKILVAMQRAKAVARDEHTTTRSTA